ncbi:MAG: MBL fold metallo-hydrolase [Dehalococcoidia bacterium]|nr:MBL fold metallo-hydrolase [Dehalococcoidia bacterium]
MKIKWLGHACFLITAKDGLRIMTDPYAVGGGIKYAPVTEAADIVTVSHDHGDHSNASAVQGKPEVVKGSGARVARGIQLRAIATYHDQSQGKQRGPNTVFCFEVDGIRLCHLGDLGHQLDPGQVKEIGAVDILFVPVGGFYTIDAAIANRTVDQLNPRAVIPMHFRTARCDYPIADVEDFLKGKADVTRLEGSEAEFEPDSLPAPTRVVVLQPAL